MKTHFHAANGNECFAFSNVLNVKRTLVVVVVVVALFTRFPEISAHLLR